MSRLTPERGVSSISGTPRIRGIADGPLSEREVATYEAGMLDGADQILEQDEPLRAERDALAARVRELERALRGAHALLWANASTPAARIENETRALEMIDAALAPTQRDALVGDVHPDQERPS